ncbi:DNA primase [Candidatus Woesearchaeota archaeon]|nr:DNA primase [Candidatus Woesearchaeota archaeon]
MGKISPVSAKYIIQATIQIDGMVERPDIIGAVFGQTEGLLGEDLELRELQRSGRIGRIEVKSDIKNGRVSGQIIIPSSLDKSETAVVAASLETIERIGPCNAKVTIDKIEDVRITKRSFVVDRAKALLKNLTQDILPDSHDITEEVASSVRAMEVVEYGPDKLPAGPDVKDAEEIIFVEGRADVVNLLRNGIKNAIAMQGTSMPDSLIPLAAKKTVTLFVDGDRGGDLIIKEVTSKAEIDFITKAPPGIEVEEMAKKEIHKALRARIPSGQAKEELVSSASEARREHRVSKLASPAEPPMREKPVETPRTRTSSSSRPPSRSFDRERPSHERRFERSEFRPQERRAPSVSREPKSLSPDQKTKCKSFLEDLIGTRGAYLLDENFSILGKIPITEIASSLKDLKVFGVVFDGIVEKEIIDAAEIYGVKLLVGTNSKARDSHKLIILTEKDL